MAHIHKGTRRTGDVAEGIACGYLSDRGFAILDRNYQKRWGELDIVALKEGILHFFEVKSVTLPYGVVKEYVPESNVHSLKGRKISRMIETYLEDKKCSRETPFHFHVLSVYMDMSRRKARIVWLKNLVL